MTITLQFSEYNLCNRFGFLLYMWLGQNSIESYCLMRIWNHIVEMRWLWNHLIFPMRFPILIRHHLYIESCTYWVIVRKWDLKWCHQVVRMTPPHTLLHTNTTHGTHQLSRDGTAASPTSSWGKSVLSFLISLFFPWRNQFSFCVIWSFFPKYSQQKPLISSMSVAYGVFFVSSWYEWNCRHAQMTIWTIIHGNVFLFHLYYVSD